MDLINMSDGNWLAHTPVSEKMSIGAFGATEVEARERFDEAVQLRQSLYAQARGVEPNPAA
jgi:hypothetical protein